MNLNRLKALLERHEGIRYKPYKCTKGKNTVGIGHNMDANPLPEYMAVYLADHGKITDPMVTTLLNKGIDEALRQCRILWPGFDTFKETRQIALADFMFQVGSGTARKFRRANASINAGEWERAADEMFDSLWAKQTPTRAAEIVEMIREG